MNTDDVVKILDAVGDSWPAAVVVVTLVIGFVAIRALPRLKDITESLKVLRHEFVNNSGTTMRDAMDRTEQIVAETKAALDSHITEDAVWKAQAEELLTRDDPPRE